MNLFPVWLNLIRSPHIQALELDRVPGHLIILGGGYIGLEFAQAMRRFGARVTIIDRNIRLVSHEDEDVSSALTELCQTEGIELVLNAHVTRVAGASGQSVKLQVTQGASEIMLDGTDLLVAAGRTPNTSALGLGPGRGGVERAWLHQSQ